MKETLKRIYSEYDWENINVISRDIDIPYDVKKIISIIGPRRAGKTYILYQLIKELLHLKKDINILYLNFEDERLNFNNNYDIIFDSFFELYPNCDKQRLYIFFDEIQELPNWQKFLRRVSDMLSRNIFITGSNSHLLSSEIATVLRGRTISYEILPLSFKEYLRFKNVSITKNIYSYRNKAKMVILLDEYLNSGFYPEIALIDDNKLKIKILQEYFNTIIYRDIIEHYGVKDVHLLKYIMKRLYSSLTKEYSVNKMYNEVKSMGYSIGKDRIYEQIVQLQNVYYFYSVERFEESVLKREMLNKKVYNFDNGIVKAINGNFDKESGRYFENFIFNELYKKFQTVYFFKNSYECDFLIQLNNKNYILIQVAHTITRDNIDREINGLEKAGNNFKDKKMYLVYLNNEHDIQTDYDIEILDCLEFLNKLYNNKIK